LIDREIPPQQAIVVHPLRDNDTRDPDLRLTEAQGLAEALDLVVIEARIDPLRQVRPASFFGPGKIEELKAALENAEATVLVVDTALTPVQQRNLEKALNVKVIDRTGLILEIFALRARTREGKLQVELARLTYEKSRLVRTWTHLERQRGGAGTMGGPGERQLELDRRMIADKIIKLKRELVEVRRTRTLHRASRKRVPYPIVALVGYTNAGKSTLFNRSAAANVFAKDMPFATLDPTMRAMRLPSGREIILSDTVGFITDLPTELVAAFRATLEEVAEADLLIHVRDIAHEETEGQRADVIEVLDRIHEGQKADGVETRPPLLEAWNKMDSLDTERRDFLGARADAGGLDGRPEAVLLSAVTGEGVAALFARVETFLGERDKDVRLTLGPDHGKARAWLYEHGVARNETAHDDGTTEVAARLSQIDRARFVRLFPDVALTDGL